jgi:hypothetical protein
MEKLKASIQKFKNLQLKYKDFGAGDTEPDTIFQNRIDKFIKFGDIALPKDQKEWQLFNIDNAYTVAQELSFGLLGVIATISKSKQYDTPIAWAECKNFINNEILWR